MVCLPTVFARGALRRYAGASHADLDDPLWRAVSDWLAADWPFEKVDYAVREGA